MSSAEIIALFLLVLRLIAVYLLFRVLKTQIKLLRLPIDPDIWDFRRKLHYMTIVILVGNILPIVLDSLVVLKGLGMLEFVRTSPFLIAYALSNAITGVAYAFLIFTIYKLAGNGDAVDEFEKKALADKAARKKK